MSDALRTTQPSRPSTQATGTLSEAVGRRVRASFDRQTLMKTMGATLDEVAYGRVVVSLPFRADLCQQDGFIHAAATAAIADSACGYAALSVMPEGSEVLSVEFKVNLLRPAVGVRFDAVASVVRAGKTITVVTAEVLARDADGGKKVVSIMTATMFRVEASGG